MSVADLLAQSRAAHQRSFQHRGRIDTHGKVIPGSRHLSKAGQDIQQALSLRLDAEAADPQHEDPAWIADQQANKGQTSEALIGYYGKYLAPIEGRAN